MKRLISTIVFFVFLAELYCQSPTANLNTILAYYNESALINGSPPPDIVPRMYSTIYQDVSGGSDVITAEFSLGIPFGAFPSYRWYKDGVLWYEGESFALSDVVWDCDNLFLLRLDIEYVGVVYTRSVVCRIYWSNDLYADCENEYESIDADNDSFCMSFCTFEEYEFLDFPVSLDVDGNFVINTADLLSVLASF